MLQGVLIIPASFLILAFKNQDTDTLYYEKLEIDNKRMTDNLVF
jgi:hypothetical protein